MLTSYPPACLNRDDLNRPKTAKMGGVQRLRISSQCLKRAWRTSGLFQEAMAGHIGTRTKEIGRAVYEALTKGRTVAVVLDAIVNHRKVESSELTLKIVSEKDANDWAQAIVGRFGKREKADQKHPLQELETGQLVHFSPEEIGRIAQLVEMVRDRGKGPTAKELELLQKETEAVDIAMFGRMLTKGTGEKDEEKGKTNKGESLTEFCKEAAVQVAHAVSVHEVAVEDDFFTAVDDLNRGEEDRGSAHMGETEFGAGVFYSYICINKDLLVKNLQSNAALAAKAMKALVEAAAKVAPSGKQNSFGSRAYASYILAEKGDQQPRSLVVAFLAPVKGPDFVMEGIAELRKACEKMDNAYGPCVADSKEMNVPTGNGKLDDILGFVAGA